MYWCEKEMTLKFEENEFRSMVYCHETASFVNKQLKDWFDNRIRVYGNHERSGFFDFSSYKQPENTHEAIIILTSPIVKDSPESLLKEIVNELPYIPPGTGLNDIIERAKRLLGNS